MFTNGFLQYKIVNEDAEFNEYGEPVSDAASEWSEPIACSIKTNKDNRKGKYEDGEFRVASFIILLEDRNEPFDANRVRLERYGNTLGEYRVQSIEELRTVGRLQIIV
jgi:hypothetical protein